MGTLLLDFLAGAFLVNGLPHLLNGLSGRAFPTPFARPPGRGESSARTNVLWSACNFVLAYLIGVRGAHFDAAQPAALAALALGGLAMALTLAWHFGALYGGATARPRD